MCVCDVVTCVFVSFQAVYLPGLNLCVNVDVSVFWFLWACNMCVCDYLPGLLALQTLVYLCFSSRCICDGVTCVFARL